ncbi:MAG: NAD(P)H-hydrate epimerase, partial [Proteobacteria bacterium]|nr:NAD(P)H-hydrate epimerase [Pseudomonadota bacterium]
MIPIDGQPILTAAEMRAAEERTIAAGSSIEQLMERAGAGIAEAVRRLAAGSPVLILCGPGNNGGDGYVAARVLRDNGVDVRVAATGEPNTEASLEARKRWNGEVSSSSNSGGAPILVDAIFGTGLTRPLTDDVKVSLATAASHARLKIAVDLPSGVDADTGAVLGVNEPVTIPFGERFAMTVGTRPA